MDGIKAIFLVMFLLTILVTPYMMFASPKQQLYSRIEVILDNLGHPRIQTIDRQGRIYFTLIQSYEDTYRCILNRLNPITGEVKEIVSHNGGSIYLVHLDMRNNIYYAVWYIILDEESAFSYAFCELYKLPFNSKVSKVIYRTEKNWVITGMAVDRKLENIYFAVSRRYRRGMGSYVSSPSKLLTISPNGEIKTLIEFDETVIGKIHIPMNPREGIFFVARGKWGSNVTYIYQYKDGKLNLLMERHGPGAFFMNIALDSNGDLYYYYRERHYIEVGMFRRMDIERGLQPTILFSEGSEDKIYWGSIALELSLTNDLFFVIHTIKVDNFREREEKIIWFNIKTNTYTCILSNKYSTAFPASFSFVTDARGNLYVSRCSVGGERHTDSSGDIICIYRR